MKNQGFLVILLLSFSIMIKFVNGIIAGPITTFLIFSAMMICLIAAIKSSLDKQLSSLSKLSKVLLNISWAFSVVAVYFKIQLFPKADLLLILSLILLTLSFIFNLWDKLKNKVQGLNMIIFGLGIFLIVLIMSLISTNKIIEICYRNDLKQGELMKRLVLEPKNELIIQEIEDYRDSKK